MGIRQVWLRHSTLTARLVGSNPTCPACLYHRQRLFCFIFVPLFKRISEVRSVKAVVRYDSVGREIAQRLVLHVRLRLIIVCMCGRMVLRKCTSTKMLSCEGLNYMCILIGQRITRLNRYPLDRQLSRLEPPSHKHILKFRMCIQTVQQNCHTTILLHI